MHPRATLRRVVSRDLQGVALWQCVKLSGGQAKSWLTLQVGEGKGLGERLQATFPHVRNAMHQAITCLELC